MTTNPPWKELADKCHAIHCKKSGFEIGSLDELRYTGIALAGEVGELCNMIKKQWNGRINMTHEEFIASSAYIEELVDIQVYLWHLITLQIPQGVDFDLEVAKKIQKVLDRPEMRGVEV